MEPFVIILSTSVFILLTFTFSLLIYNLYKANAMNIKNGSYDSSIIEDDKKKIRKKRYIVSYIVLFIQLILLLMVAFTIFTAKKPVNSISRPSVVLTGSMREKNKENKYLVDNNLDNQIQTSDLIFIEKLPDELKQYDIVVYILDGNLIVHRIIDEIKDDKGETCYILRGDANASSDMKPVYKEQMIGIYNGHKIQCLGLFIRFLKSIPGILCIILVFVYSLINPFISKRFNVLRRLRASQIRLESVRNYEN